MLLLLKLFSLLLVLNTIFLFLEVFLSIFASFVVLLPVYVKVIHLFDFSVSMFLMIWIFFYVKHLIAGYGGVIVDQDIVSIHSIRSAPLDSAYESFAHG